MFQKFRQKMHLPLLLAPAMTVIVVLFMGGVVMGMIQSLGYMPAVGAYQFSLKAYFRLFQNPAFRQSLLLTCWISLITTTLSTVLAITCALILRQNLWGRRLATFIFQLNVPVPHVVGAIAIAFLFSQSGLLARFAYSFGLITTPADFPALVFDPLAIGVITEYLWKAIPFTGIILLAILRSVGEDYEALAQTLGAGRWQRFRYVLLPLMMPGILRASILVFAFSFGSYEVPFLLGKKYPPTLPVLAFEYYRNVDLAFRQEAMALSIIIAFLAIFVVLIYMKLAELPGRVD